MKAGSVSNTGFSLELSILQSIIFTLGSISIFLGATLVYQYASVDIILSGNSLATLFVNQTIEPLGTFPYFLLSLVHGPH